jgi:hypothetical protein
MQFVLSWTCLFLRIPGHANKRKAFVRITGMLSNYHRSGILGVFRKALVVPANK